MSNIYIYVKTPSIKNSNMHSHIVEHCVLNKKDLSIKDFYSTCDIKAECYMAYTKFDIYKKLNIKEFIAKITNPLDKEIFKKELKTFKQETKNHTFTDDFRNKVIKLMYNDLIQIKKYPSWEEINSYHKKHYKTDKIIICDSQYKIIENNIKTRNIGKRSLKIIKKVNLSISGEQNKISILSYNHWKSQALLYFIEFLCDTYIEYTERSIKGNYNFPTSSMIEMEKYICIALPQNIKYNISHEFLDEAKKHFCNIAVDEYARKIGIINLLYIGQLPTDKEIKTFIQSINIDTIKKIIISK